MPSSDVDEWHRLVSEVPEQEEITIIAVSVALVLLSQCYSIDAIHGRMSHDAEARELDIYLLVGSEYLAES